MKKEKAIRYLNGKGKLQSIKYSGKENENGITEEEKIKSDDEEISEVVKRGKIYGDPIVEILE